MLIVNIQCNVRFTHSSIHIIHTNADRITERVTSGSTVFACITKPTQSNPNKPCQKLWMSLTLLLH